MLDGRDASSAPDLDLVAQLLTEAIAALDERNIEAKRRILQARALVLAPGAHGEIASGGLAGWQMRRIANFVHFNIATKLRIEHAAEGLKVSPGYLSRAFKTTAGMTYTHYVIRARVGLAKRLLLTTEDPIAEIAIACGLNDQSHLTRVFKRATGVTPGSWRRQFGVEHEDDPPIVEAPLHEMIGESAADRD